MIRKLMLREVVAEAPILQFAPPSYSVVNAR
jgi:hypothetical protein